jgi:hypothetical protein
MCTQAVPEDATQASRRAERFRRVLLLEDDAEMAHLLSLSLTESGRRVTRRSVSDPDWVPLAHAEHDVVVASIASEASAEQVLGQVRDHERGRQPMLVVLLTAGRTDVPEWSPVRLDPRCRLLSKASVSIGSLLAAIDER